MTDITKYRNVSLTHETYKEGHFLSTVLFDGLQVSMSQLIESLISKKIEELNLKDKVAQYYWDFMANIILWFEPKERNQ